MSTAMKANFMQFINFDITSFFLIQGAARGVFFALAVRWCRHATGKKPLLAVLYSRDRTNYNP